MSNLGKSNISWRDCIIVLILAVVAYTLHFHAKEVKAMDEIKESLSRIETLLNEPIETDFNIK